MHELVQRGHKVAAVKSTKENVPPPPETDTGKHIAAGAEPVFLVGPSTTIVRFDRRLELPEIVHLVAADFLIVEGMKHAEIPRFWCVGDRTDDIVEAPKHTKAIIVWSDASRNIIQGLAEPVHNSEDIDVLANIIEREAVAIESLAVD